MAAEGGAQYWWRSEPKEDLAHSVRHSLWPRHVRVAAGEQQRPAHCGESTTAFSAAMGGLVARCRRRTTADALWRPNAVRLARHLRVPAGPR